MKYSNEILEKIYDKTQGYCHICHGKLCYSNYGIFDARGAWEVEHSNAKANGGTDHGNNLFPAHITCNRSKGKLTSRSARAKYGNTRAPLSKKRQDKIRNNNTVGGAIVGGVVGIPFGPIGIIIGVIGGALIGESRTPEI